MLSHLSVDASFVMFSICSCSTLCDTGIKNECAGGSENDQIFPEVFG